MKSMISLEMKCPQLSKKRRQRQGTQKSIGDRMEKKPWEKPGSVGGPIPLRPDKPVVLFQLQQSQIVRLHWFQWSFPDGCLGDEVLTGDLSLGLI